MTGAIGSEFRAAEPRILLEDVARAELHGRRLPPLPSKLVTGTASAVATLRPAVTTARARPERGGARFTATR